MLELVRLGFLSRVGECRTAFRLLLQFLEDLGCIESAKGREVVDG